MKNISKVRIGNHSLVFEIGKMKVRDIIKTIEQNGWVVVRIRGSHRQFNHNEKQGVVTIAGHLNDDLAKGTLKSIFEQAGLTNGRK